MRGSGRSLPMVIIPPLCFLAWTVLRDPYFRYLDASEVRLRAPAWQTALGVADVAILIIVVILLIRQRHRAAFYVLAVETLLNIGTAVLYLERDGVRRFTRGFGAEQTLTVYLATVALRIVLLCAISAWLFRSPGERESTG